MRRWLIALFAFVGLSALVIATRVALTDAHRDAHWKLTFYAREVSRNLENGLQDRLTVVEALRAFLLAHDEVPDQEMFDRFAALLLPVEPSIRALQYADETVTIRYVYPLAGNEAALGLRPLDHPEMRPSAERAIRERITTVSSPFELVQGGLGIVVRAPIYRGDQFLGLAQGVFDVPAVVTASLPVADPRFDIQIADAQGRRFWGPARFAYEAKTTWISVGDTRWRVTVGWRKAPPGPPTLTLALIWGLGGLSLALALFTLYREMERAVSLEQMVAARTAALTASEKRYRSLFEMDQRILQGEPVEAILPFLCQQVAELFDLRMVWIGFKEPDGGVRPAAAWGLEEGYLETIHIRWDGGPESEGPTGTAIRTGKPSVITDIAEDPHYAPWREAALARGYRSSAAIPLRDDGSVLGVLNVYAEQPNAFEGPRLEELVDFARHVTVALVAAQTRQQLEEQEKALRERNRQLAALNRLSAAIITTLDLETILEEALEVVQQVTGFDAGGIGLLDEDNRLDPLAVRGVSLSLLATFTATPRPGGLRDQALTRREALFIEDGEKDPNFNPQVRAAGYRGAALIPLVARDRLLGMLVLGWKRPHPWPQRRRDLLLAMADQMAVVIENASLYRETTRQVRELSTLFRVSALLSSTLDVDEVVQRITWEVTEAMGVDGCTVSRWDAETRTVTAIGDHVRPDYTDATGEKDDLGLPYSLDEYPATERVLRERKPLVVRRDDPNADPAEQALLKAFGWGSLLMLPMVAGNRVVGLMELYSADPAHAFDTRTIQLAQTLANQAAIAMENARLHQALWRHARELEQLVAERTAELRREQERIQAILEAAGEGIVVTDVKGTIQYINPATSALTGYSLEEALGRTPSLWKSGVHPPEFYQTLWKTILAGRVWRGEVVNRRKDGTFYDASLTITPLRDEQGNLVGFVGIQNDITHRKEVERLKDQFISSVSHELRTPLTNLKLYLTLLERGQPEKQRYYLTTLQREAERLHYLVENLLSLSRLDLGEAEISRMPTDVNVLVRLLVEDRETMAADRGLTLEAELAEDLPYALVDRPMIEQVLTNLLTNAMNYTPWGGKIVVRTAKRVEEGRSWVTISIEDTGAGIPPEELPYIFERFYRGEAARRSGVPGTGLGLAICKEIVDRHGGRITVESEEGKGSTFTVWLVPAWWS